MASMQRTWLIIGGVFGLTAVAAGAFGAHGLKERIDADMLAVWETAARYQVYHALALMGLGALMGTSRGGGAKPQAAWVWAGRCWTLGVVVFSGSLYTLALSGVKWLGAITPFGGALLMVGWMLLIAHAVKGGAHADDQG